MNENQLRQFYAALINIHTAFREMESAPNPYALGTDWTQHALDTLTEASNEIVNALEQQK